MRPFDIVVAIDLNSGIGKNGALPWHLLGDMKHFKDLTTATQSDSKKNAVMMGRKTWESLSEKFRPLPQRINLILTHNKALSFPDGVLKADGLSKALAMLDEAKFKNTVETVFLIGGGEIFKEAIKSPH